MAPVLLNQGAGQGLSRWSTIVYSKIHELRVQLQPYCAADVAAGIGAAVAVAGIDAEAVQSQRRLILRWRNSTLTRRAP